MIKKFTKLLSITLTASLFIQTLGIGLMPVSKVYAASSTPVLSASDNNKLDVALSVGTTTTDFSTFEQDLRAALVARGVATADLNISNGKDIQESLASGASDCWVYDHYNTNSTSSGTPASAPTNPAYPPNTNGTGAIDTTKPALVDPPYTGNLIDDTTHQYVEGYLEQNSNFNLNRHIIVEDNGQTVIMNGYGAPSFRDFMYIANTEATKKTIEFKVQELAAFDALDGCGFLLNTTISGNYGAGQKMSGYLLFLQYNTSGRGSAIKLYKFENVDTKAFHSVDDDKVIDNIGFTLLASSNNYLPTDAWRHIKIEAYPSMVKMWYKGGTTEDNGVLSDSQLVNWDIAAGGKGTAVALPGYTSESYGFGPMISYRSHGCARPTQFKFKSLSMHSDKVKSLTEVVNEPEWRDISQKFMVNLNEAAITDFSDSQKASNLANLLNTENAKYVGWGSNINKDDTKTFLGQNGDKGTFVNIDDAETSTYQEQINAIATYITATYNKIYVVTFDSQGGSAVSPVSITSGAAITLPTNPTKTGYTFAGWNIAANGTGAAITVNTIVTANATVYAQWTAIVPKIYTISFDSNGGSVVSPVSITSGAAITLPTNPTKSGYTFAGWNTAANGTGEVITVSTVVTADATVYAQWTAIVPVVDPVIPVVPVSPITYNLTYTAGINGSITGAAIQVVKSGESGAAVTAVPNSGYYFVNWSDGVATATRTDSNIATDINVTANFALTSSSDGGSTSTSTTTTTTTATTTIKGDVLNGKNGQSFGDIAAQVTTEVDGTKTVTMKSADAIALKGPDGTRSVLTDLTKLSYSTPTASSGTVSVEVAKDGTIKVKGLVNGSEVNLDIFYDLGNGVKIKLGAMKVTVSSTGTVTLSIELIDPYGIITDEATGKVIDGVNVTLYYANTARNKAAGKTPDTVVELPLIDGFKPNNNKDPQTSDASGAYGFMVFPVSDYYIVGTKDGYMNYTSPTISVEQEIVKWNFAMHANGGERLAGDSRVDTALAIAKATYQNTLSNVILATSENYPDALAGSVLAYKFNAPILLVGTSSEDQAKVLDYLKANMNSTGKVYILGGSTVVNTDMETKITALGLGNIIRLAGADRFETAVKIADTIGIKEGTPIVLVAGENYADALSISSVAAVNQYPILIVGKDGISDSVKKEISTIKPSKVFIIGSQGAVSTTVEDQVSQVGTDKENIVRIGGASRFETSLLVAKYFKLTGTITCIATGNDFPDALAGSIYAAKNNAHIILVDKALTESETAYLQNEKISGATIFGGVSVVSKDIEEQLDKILSR